ncbi:MAG: HAD-IIB family hydrolase [candidate division NC10 bacterium]|nr:HAD-IIB family hydrolase [Candidatus Rokubacteria bacterium]MBI3029661.1 HAD-IIB family hydrolase [Candidatus Rokubacteria bacterium]MBI4390349.1 HAD-IIB family hydrolase [candidate division NC10 bacterium]
MPEQFVIYTDLDGCLLDRETYSAEAARPALDLLRKERIPLVLCSSKTQAEVEYHRDLLGLTDPFVVENGGAILIPMGYFPFPHAFTRTTGPYQRVEFGVSYARLTETLRELEQATGLRLRGFSEMSLKEVISLTGLDPDAARRAKARQYDEPFVADLSPAHVERLETEVQSRGLALVGGGRFYHLTGRHSKGLAVDFLTRLYRTAFPRLVTVGIGDAENDVPVLQRVDIPVVIPRESALVDPAFEGRRWAVAPAPGPTGWTQAVLAILSGQWEGAARP